jgi:hypothetical protein
MAVSQPFQDFNLLAFAVGMAINSYPRSQRSSLDSGVDGWERPSGPLPHRFTLRRASFSCISVEVCRFGAVDTRTHETHSLVIDRVRLRSTGTATQVHRPSDRTSNRLVRRVVVANAERRARHLYLASLTKKLGSLYGVEVWIHRLEQDRFWP